MNTREFVKKYDGRSIDFDSKNGGQCVDLYRQCCKEVLDVPQSPALGINGGAADIWTTYLKDYFEAIKNTPEGFPQEGDIVIWNRRAGGGYGHVAVALSGDVNSFKSFDQNWSRVSFCEVVTHNYTNVIGWLRRKTPQIGTTMDWQTERDERNKNWSLYQGEIAAHKLTKDKHDAFIKQLASIYKSPEDEESIVKFATENAKVLDEKNMYKDKYEREVQSRKEDYENYQRELEGYKKELNQLRTEKEALERRLDHVEDKINTTLEDASIAKEKIEEKKNEYPQYSSDVVNNVIQSMIKAVYEKIESLLTKGNTNKKRSSNPR